MALGTLDIHCSRTWQKYVVLVSSVSTILAFFCDSSMPKNCKRRARFDTHASYAIVHVVSTRSNVRRMRTGRIDNAFRCLLNCSGHLREPMLCFFVVGARVTMQMAASAIKLVYNGKMSASHVGSLLVATGVSKGLTITSHSLKPIPTKINKNTTKNCFLTYKEKNTDPSAVPVWPRVCH